MPGTTRAHRSVHDQAHLEPLGRQLRLRGTECDRAMEDVLGDDGFGTVARVAEVDELQRAAVGDDRLRASTAVTYGSSSRPISTKISASAFSAVASLPWNRSPVAITVADVR
jgi:hypothetical protein